MHVEECDGRCCGVFSIRDDVDWTKVVDGEFIAAMLVPLGREEAITRAVRFDVPVEQAELPDGWTPHTCKHWDETTPSHCRDYLYDLGCQHGCGGCSTPEVVAKWAERRRLAAEREAEVAT